MEQNELENSINHQRELYEYLHNKLPKYGMSSYRVGEVAHYLNPQVDVTSVLDVGCGHGQVLLWIQQNLPDIETFTGIDISEKSVAKTPVASITRGSTAVRTLSPLHYDLASTPQRAGCFTSC